MKTHDIFRSKLGLKTGSYEFHILSQNMTLDKYAYEQNLSKLADNCKNYQMFLLEICKRYNNGRYELGLSTPRWLNGNVIIQDYSLRSPNDIKTALVNAQSGYGKVSFSYLTPMRGAEGWTPKPYSGFVKSINEANDYFTLTDEYGYNHRNFKISLIHSLEREPIEEKLYKVSLEIVHGDYNSSTVSFQEVRVEDIPHNFYPWDESKREAYIANLNEQTAREYAYKQYLRNNIFSVGQRLNIQLPNGQIVDVDIAHVHSNPSGGDHPSVI